MAYVSTLDERSYGGNVSLGADYLDASNTTNSTFVLAEGQTGYGNLTDAYVSADEDVYSLGVLDTGYYSIGVDEFVWDFSSSNIGSVSRFELLGAFGQVLQTSYSTFSDLSFSVLSAGTYYVRIVGASGLNEQQYAVSYEKTGNLNTPATWGTTATYYGGLFAGNTIDASVSVSDADGNSDGVVLTRWYIDGVDQGYLDTIDLGDDSVGKLLSFVFTFVDDEGNTETSPIYHAGLITVGASVSSTSSYSLPDLEHVLNLTLTGSANIYGYGNSNDNLIVGNIGDNRLKGYAGADSLQGGMGNDQLDGGTGNDRMTGGSGNDVYIADVGDAIIEVAGEGTDTVQASVNFKLGSNVENLTLTGFAGAVGTGNNLANMLQGNGGSNLLIGAAAADKLLGGAGNDTLKGGTGLDVLSGNGGRDYFAFASVSESASVLTTADIIMDFKRGEDKIDLRSIDAFAPTVGNDVFAWKGTGAINSASQGEVRYQKFDNAGTGNDYTLIQIDNDRDAAAEMLIRVNGLHNFTATDFVL